MANEKDIEKLLSNRGWRFDSWSIDQQAKQHQCTLCGKYMERWEKFLDTKTSKLCAGCVNLCSCAFEDIGKEVRP